VIQQGRNSARERGEGLIWEVLFAVLIFVLV